MAKTIPTTLALLLLAASGAHADTLLSTASTWTSSPRRCGRSPACR